MAVQRWWVVVVICAATVLPAQLVGGEAFRLYRWLFDRAVAASDTLFAAPLWVLRLAYDWGAWIVDGFVTGALAAIVARLVTRVDLSAAVVFATIAMWALLKAGEFLLFPALQLAAWPYSGSFGFLAGLLGGLAAAAALLRPAAASQGSGA